jgi:sugar phosphate permease
MYIATASFAGAFGGLLASGILRLDRFGSTKRWEMIFAIEGVITICISLISFFTLTDRPQTARWLNQEEKRLAEDRIKSERVSTSEVLDKIDLQKLLKGVRSPVTLSTSVIFLLTTVTVQSVSFFAPTIVRTIYPHASVVTQQLYTVPPYILGSLSCLIFNFISSKIDRRNILMIVCLPFVVAGYVIFLATTNAHARYAATFLIAFGIFTFGALINAQLSANVVSDSARSAAIAFGGFWCNCGGLISTWTFLAPEAPNYPSGNGLNLATSVTSLLVAIGLEIWMRHDNSRRRENAQESSLAEYSELEIQRLDWKHPAFRWRP